MDVFDLVAKITINSDDYESGLKNASEKTSSFGSKLSSGLKKAAKVGAAAITTATTAVAGFAANSVKAGAAFDSSMSQVAATMGTTVDQIQDLSDFAQEMGSTTAFSATQAADALNFMALAGYDAETSMSMLPNVLNLAAAGGIELASASDMVTDASSALGLSLDETAKLVDQMAKASSKSNTSVAQLGEAILTVGGTAKTLSGGTTELSAALGILADNGVKGAEGGTALRNIILSLSAPTDKAAMAMKDLGIEVFDTDGNMRPLNETFGDFSEALSKLSTQEQTNVLNDIFNKVDLKSVNALLSTSAERWDELTVSIDNAQGAAEKMAETQLDNLSGDVTLFKSALEGANIAVSKKLTPSLRKFVQFGTQGIGKITAAFDKDGLSGAMEELGKTISDGLAMVAENLPQAMESGMQLIGSIGQGIIDNLPTILNSAGDIVQTLIDGISDALPSLFDNLGTILDDVLAFIFDRGPDLIKSGMNLISKLADGIVDAIPKLIDRLPQLIDDLLDFFDKNFDTILDQGTEIITKLADGIIGAIPDLVKKLPKIITSIVDFFKDPEKLKDLIDSGTEIIGSISDAIIGAVNGLSKALPEIIQYIFEWLMNPENVIELTNSGVEIVAAIAQGILKSLGNLGVLLLDGIQNYMFGVGSTAEMGEYDKEEAEKSSETFLKKTSNAKTLRRDDLLTESFISAERKRSGKFASELLGQETANGFANGVKAGTDNVVKASDLLTESFVTATRKKLDIHSPSRVFANIGSLTAEGFGVGFEDEFSNVKRDIDRSLDFGTASVDFASSGLGATTAGLVNGLTQNADGERGGSYTINLMLPDGAVLASYLLGPLIDMARANGTPIANPIT